MIFLITRSTILLFTIATSIKVLFMTAMKDHPFLAFLFTKEFTKDLVPFVAFMGFPSGLWSAEVWECCGRLHGDM